jgi:hypothetical protein
MATVAWETFRPLVTPDVPGCPLEIVDRELAITASDFFARTQLWREDLESQNTVVDQAFYDITDCAIVESVIWAKVDDIDIKHTDERLVDPEFLTRKGKPTHFWIEKETQIRLHPIPDQVFPLDVRLVLKPSRTARGVPDFVYQRWADAFVSGAIYRIARTPNKEWTNAQQAALHKNLYEQAVTNARIRDFRNIDLQVRMKRF